MELFRALGSLVETPTPETASVAALLDLGEEQVLADGELQAVEGAVFWIEKEDVGIGDERNLQPAGGIDDFPFGSHPATRPDEKQARESTFDPRDGEQALRGQRIIGEKVKPFGRIPQ